MIMVGPSRQAGSRASRGLESRLIQSALERKMYMTARRTLAECVMFVSSSQLLTLISPPLFPLSVSIPSDNDERDDRITQHVTKDS